MDQIEEFVDERQKSWCIHCGGSMVGQETNRDHVPSKSLLREPYPANLPIVQVCETCNNGFSLDEEYLIAFVGSVLAGSTHPDRQTDPNTGRIQRWSAKLRTRIERSRTEHETLGGEKRLLWTPEAERINRVILKNAHGHAYFEFGEPMLSPPEHIWWAPLESLTSRQRVDFETIGSGGLLPEVGSRMFERLRTGQDLSDGWVVVQDAIYRYAAAQVGVMLVRSVLFEYLATEAYWGP